MFRRLKVKVSSVPTTLGSSYYVYWERNAYMRHLSFHPLWGLTSHHLWNEEGLQVQVPYAVKVIDWPSLKLCSLILSSLGGRDSSITTAHWEVKTTTHIKKFYKNFIKLFCRALPRSIWLVWKHLYSQRPQREIRMYYCTNGSAACHQLSSHTVTTSPTWTVLGP